MQIALFSERRAPEKAREVPDMPARAGGKVPFFPRKMQRQKCVARESVFFLKKQSFNDSTVLRKVCFSYTGSVLSHGSLR